MRRPARLLVLPLTLAASLAACGDEPGPAINEGPIRNAFENASAESGVPLDLLLAIGWHETRWTQITPEIAADPSAEGGHGEVDDGFQGGFGIMQLSERPDHDTLTLAANLSGKTPDELKKDPAANVLGAALVLRRYADEMFEGADVEQLDLFAWRDVVARWSGIDDPGLAYDAADEVYQVLRDGAGRTLDSGEILELMPNPGLANAEDGTVAPSTSGIWARSEDGLGYSGAHWNPAASSNYTNGRGGNGIHYIVIHTMQGGYAGSISWFKNPAAKVSAHYCVRSHDGDVTQMVDENDTAWHAGNWTYNQQSIGIEHEGFIEDAAWFTDAMYRSSARLACDLVRRHNIPVDRHHIIGHVEVPGATHKDPGPRWNWDYYMSLIRECTGGGGPADNPHQGGGGSTGGGGSVHPGNGTIQGVVYADGDMNHRVGGASIKLSNGLTATAASNGYWSLSVAAGSYTVTASASGYNGASVTRTVTAGGQTWASTSLTKGASVQNGRLSGIVFEAGDSSRRIAGATVAISGRSATTDANGRYSLDVPPGTPTATVSASGYLGKSLGTTIRGGQTTTLNVGLTHKTASGSATVVGVVYELPDDHKRIASASVSISNGSETHQATADGAGYFEFPNLPAGTWRVTATAAGWGTGSHTVTAAAGSKMWGSVGLTRPGVGGGANTGAADGELIGVIYESPDSTKRIAGATVSLSTGARVTTGSDGVYRIRARGSVTAVATAPGYAPKSVNRTVAAGTTTWGSIGLTKGAANGSDLVKDCKPSQPAIPHNPPHDAVPVNPLAGEYVTATPTLEFTGTGDPSASYIVRIVPNDKNAKNIEFKVGPGDKQRVQPPKALAKDAYAWTVVPLWPDCKTAEPAKWGFFIVQ